MSFFSTSKAISNRKRWISFMHRPDYEEELRDIIVLFILPDNIDQHLFFENFKANQAFLECGGLDFWIQSNSLSAYAETRNEKINCSPTFREHYAKDFSSNMNREPSIPDWFYICYPDVGVWLQNNSQVVSDQLEAWEDKCMDDDGLTLFYFRLVIEMYKSNMGKLECSIQ